MKRQAAVVGLITAARRSGPREHGAEAAERFTAAPVDLSVFGSKARESFVLFDLARGWLQAGGSRDSEALRALDTADRIAPLQVRNDPLARDLALTLDRRAPRRVWELDSLLNRLGLRSSKA